MRLSDTRKLETCATAVGLDIGGANLKAAHSNGQARSLAFPLWKDRAGLGERLRRLVAQFSPADAFAVTMTGELCDCFASQAEGVGFILDSVEQALGAAPIRVWSLDGVFLSLEEARRRPGKVAAANWFAQAMYAARLVPDRAAMLIDMGSTTTDIIPLLDGKPRQKGLPDPERMRLGELVYTGARRTPVCAVLGAEVAAELFATMEDVYLVLGDLRADRGNHATTDGRPATVENAHARLARMLCADPATSAREMTLALARRARRRQWAILKEAIAKVEATLPRRPEAFLLSGAGAFVLRRLGLGGETIDLGRRWGEEISSCACAWAVALLALECGDSSPLSFF